VTAAEFRAAHGDPLGDQAHEPWTRGEWDEFDHLNATAVDTQPRGSDDEYVTRMAAVLGLAIPTQRSAT
jgi:hypothetical protein